MSGANIFIGLAILAALFLILLELRHHRPAKPVPKEPYEGITSLYLNNISNWNSKDEQQRVLEEIERQLRLVIPGRTSIGINFYYRAVPMFIQAEHDVFTAEQLRDDVFAAISPIGVK